MLQDYCVHVNYTNKLLLKIESVSDVNVVAVVIACSQFVTYLCTYACIVGFDVSL